MRTYAINLTDADQHDFGCILLYGAIKCPLALQVQSECMVTFLCWHVSQTSMSNLEPEGCLFDTDHVLELI